VAVLALDVGSSELKAAVHGEAGTCLAIRSVEYPHVASASGIPELDPDVLWASVQEAAVRVVRQCRKERVVAACISSHGESFVPLSKQNKALRPFLLNVDSRATAEMEGFVRSFGASRLYELTGLPPHPMYTLPKIAWLRSNEPQVFEKAAKFFCVEDYLLHRLGVGDWIGSSLAARTLGLDLKLAKWSPDLLEQVGISESMLSRVATAGQCLGTASAHAMSELGLPKETLWVSGGHDQSCGALGGGALHQGTIVDGTGTFESISVPLSEPLTSGLTLEANIPCGRHATSNEFLALAYAPGGVVLRWFRDQFGQNLQARATELGCNVYDLLLQGIPGEPTGVFVFPHFFGTGTPWLDSAARGAIIGLTSSTSRDTLIKALLEGISFEVQWNFELLAAAGISVERIFAVGGGAKSSAWLQLKADIFGREVVLVPGESSSRGAAISAAVGSGVYKTHQEAVQAMVKLGPSYFPRSAVQHRYRELFHEYKELARRLYGFELPTLTKVLIPSGAQHA
jgi:xylulokinase